MAQKNAITVRPFNIVESLFGITYERYITNNISVSLYGEYSSGPQILWNGVNNIIKSGVPTATSVDFRYSGWGVIPEVRYYFKEIDKKEVEVVIANEGKITGWFIGGYVPIRKMDIDFKINSVELYAYGLQNDQGRFTSNKIMYGIGVLGGRHWVWDMFSFDVHAGLAITSGLGGFFNNKVDFTYTRPGIGDYTVTKDLGGFGTYMMLMPRIGVSLGIAF